MSENEIGMLSDVLFYNFRRSFIASRCLKHMELGNADGRHHAALRLFKY